MIRGKTAGFVNNKKAFTMVELIFVIVIIGTLAAMAVPKFTGVKDQAIKATELSTASAIATALESIHSAWSISDDDFDWDNDGLDDDIDNELSSSGYPWDTSRNGDVFGALLKSSSKSDFKAQTDLLTQSKMRYRLFTAKATDPVRGIKYPTGVIGRDTLRKPDRNDFWLYAPEVNGSCRIKSDRFGEKKIISGDFVLIDVNGTLAVDFSDSALGMGFSVTCP